MPSRRSVPRLGRCLGFLFAKHVMGTFREQCCFPLRAHPVDHRVGEEPSLCLSHLRGLNDLLRAFKQLDEVHPHRKSCHLASSGDLLAPLAVRGWEGHQFAGSKIVSLASEAGLAVR